MVFVRAKVHKSRGFRNNLFVGLARIVNNVVVSAGQLGSVAFPRMLFEHA